MDPERSTILSKGCPLDCTWCYNEECKKLNSETTIKITCKKVLKLSYSGGGARGLAHIGFLKVRIAVKLWK